MKSSKANNKTLYLWDLAGTIFYEQWNEKKTGFKNVHEWMENHFGKKTSEMTDLEFERAHEIPYKKGYFDSDINPGFREVLSWTKHNETFSTGTKEQVAWRAAYIEPQKNIKITDYFQKLNSTFDYGETNKKTPAMLIDYLEKKYREGYRTVVYSEDKLKYLESFRQAADKFIKKHSDFSYRLYLMVENQNNMREKDFYTEVNSLFDIMANEKKIRERIYLWDAGGTLFPEKWVWSKYPSFYDFLVAKHGEDYTDWEEELTWEEAYRQGYENIKINRGFKQVLSWTKNNYVLTSGNPGQIEARREVFRKKYQLDIKDYLNGVISRLDYPRKNLRKDRGLFRLMLKEYFAKGYREFVYTEDNSQVVQEFLAAAKALKAYKKYRHIKTRVYHILNDQSGLKKRHGYFTIGSLFDLLNHEKKLDK